MLGFDFQAIALDINDTHAIADGGPHGERQPPLARSAMRVFDLSLAQMLWSRRSVFLGLLVGGVRRVRQLRDPVAATVVTARVSSSRLDVMSALIACRRAARTPRT